MAAGTVLFLNGGGSHQHAELRRRRSDANVTPGLLPGEVLISIPGAGTVDAMNYSEHQHSPTPLPIVVTPGPAVTINGVEGFQLVNQTVATFTAPIPDRSRCPGGLPRQRLHRARSTGATAPRRRPERSRRTPAIPACTTSPARTPSSTTERSPSPTRWPSRAEPSRRPVNGVPVTYTFGPSAPVAGTSATATVIQSPLAISVFPIVGTEGTADRRGADRHVHRQRRCRSDRRLLGDDHRHQLGRCRCFHSARPRASPRTAMQHSSPSTLRPSRFPKRARTRSW